MFLLNYLAAQGQGAREAAPGLQCQQLEAQQNEIDSEAQQAEIDSLRSRLNDIENRH
jgi:hypothetical protein